MVSLHSSIEKRMVTVLVPRRPIHSAKDSCERLNSSILIAQIDIFEMIYLIEISSLPTMRPELDSLVRDFFTSLHFGLVR